MIIIQLDDTVSKAMLEAFGKDGVQAAVCDAVCRSMQRKLATKFIADKSDADTARDAKWKKDREAAETMAKKGITVEIR